MAKKKVQKPNQSYELKKLKINNGSKLILGLDPGSRNFGVSLVGVSRGKIKVYANSVLMNPINDLVNFPQTSASFLKEMDIWLGYEPDGVIGERFQTRGIGGPLIEQVSIMLGLINGAYNPPWFKLTTASTWKNRLNRRFETDLKSLYPDVLVQPHQLDATLIAIYGFEEMLGTEIKYDLDNIIAQVESTSLIDLRKKKK